MGHASAAMPSSQPRKRSGRGSFAGSAMARRAARRTPAAAATAASASGQSRSAQEHSTASRCWRITSANTAVRSRVVLDCLNRCTSAASDRPPSCAVMVATPFMACGSAGHEDPTPGLLRLPGSVGDLLISVAVMPGNRSEGLATRGGTPGRSARAARRARRRPGGLRCGAGRRSWPWSRPGAG